MVQSSGVCWQNNAVPEWWTTSRNPETAVWWGWGSVHRVTSNGIHVSAIIIIITCHSTGSPLWLIESDETFWLSCLLVSTMGEPCLVFRPINDQIKRTAIRGKIGSVSVFVPFFQNSIWGGLTDSADFSFFFFFHQCFALTVIQSDAFTAGSCWVWPQSSTFGHWVAMVD